MKRSLDLKRETLAQLTADDLSGVVGARYTNDGITCGGAVYCIDNYVVDLDDLSVHPDRCLR